MLVLTYETNIEFSFIKDLKSRVPSSSIITVSNYTLDKVYKALRSEPFFTDMWFCIVTYPSVKIDIIKKLTKYSNAHVIIKVKSKRDFIEMKSILTSLSLDFSFIDYSDISKEDKIKYIRENCKCKNNNVINKIIKKSPNVSMLTKNVALLSILDEVRQVDVDKYCTRYGSLSYYSVLDYLCGTSDFSYEKVLEFIHNEVYSYKHLIDFLINNLKIYLYVYDLISVGLTAGNISSFKKKEDINKNSKIRNISENQIKRIIYTHKQLSKDKLYYIILLLEKSKSKSVYYFLNILKLGGEK